MSKIEFKERGIIFNTDMVRAILEGRKCHTRRKIKPQPKIFMGNLEYFPTSIKPYGFKLDSKEITWFCPYGKVGDRLWVRETFVTGYDVIDGEFQYCDEEGNDLPEKIWYKADDNLNCWYDADGYSSDKVPWKPSIHMPRWASRITLEITDIRVERVCEINYGDIYKEGFPLEYLEQAQEKRITEYGEGQKYSAKTDELTWFEDIWQSIYGTWNDNPWVWIIEFKVVKV